MFVFLIGAVSAADDNATLLENSSGGEVDDGSVEADPEEAQELQNASFSLPSKSSYLVGDSFTVRLLDENGTGIYNKSVYFNVNNNTRKVVTDTNGAAKILLKFSKGQYTFNFIFNETGYNPVNASKDISLLKKYSSKFKGSDMSAYAGIKKTFKVTLTSNGKPLSGRKVTFTINKKSYTKTTNSKGVASLVINMAKGTYTIKYSYKGDSKTYSCKASSKITLKLLKNPYKTKYRKVIIDADGGFTRAFLNDLAGKLRKAGWKVIVKGIGPGQHSINYKQAKNCVYMPIYNGLCAATIKEMAAGYYGGVIKKNKAVLTPSWYTKDWVSKKMSKFRTDITKFGYLKRAWDDNFSPRSFKGINDPAGFMTSHGIRYSIGDTTYKIAEQFLYGGWEAHH